MATKYYNSAASGANNGGEGNDAYQDLQTALNALSAGDHLYVKNGSSREGSNGTALTFTTSSNESGNAGATVIEGYETTPGDGGMYNTASPVQFTAEGLVLKHFDISAGASPNALQIEGDFSLIYRCNVENNYQFGFCGNFTDCSVVECTFKTTMSTGGVGEECVVINRCYFINNRVTLGNGAATTGAALRVNAARKQHSIIGNIIVCEDTDSNSFVGMKLFGTNPMQSLIMNNTIFNFDIGIEHEKGPSGVGTVPNVYLGNIIYSCADGIKNSQGTSTTSHGLYSIENAFGDITTAQTTQLGHVMGSITLTETPFINTTDFQLNNAPGGGALLKGKLGIPDPSDISPLTSLIRTDFQTHGGMIPNPVGEVSRSF